MFDDVSTAYHKKVAKDRANSEGLVVNPPDLGNLPGEGEVTYASEVKEVLIPYTTREDSFHYYEERNYVNDVNRQHTEVLQTYNRELKARETYTYGQGRSSYHHHGTGDTYQYLTNQAGSVTGLTKDGQAVASRSYNLYGSTKDSTDETGNPYAYNGEARDSTGLDYLRARYYDSQAGTFLTEDSYQGELDDPLSQNRYSYVHNNPVNYTDPSGHFPSPFTMMVGGGGRPLYQQPKPLINPKDGTLYAPTTPEHEAHQIRQQQTGVYSYTYVPSYVPTSSAYEYIQQQESQLRTQAHAQAVQYRQQQIRQEYAQSIGQYGRPKAREANNLLLNWSKALKDMFTHVCDPKTTKAKDTKGKSPSQKQLQAITKSATDANYAVNLGGVASWSGTSSASNQRQTSSKKGHTFDLSRLKTISSGNIQALAGLSGLAVGLSGGGPVAGFAVYGAVSSGLTSYSNDDKPLDVAVNTVGGGLQGYFIGKYVQGLYTAAKGAIAGVGMTLTQPKQADKPYGPEPASGPLEPLKPYGPEPASGTLDPLRPSPDLANMTRVGRWMSPEEYSKMVETGKVQISPNGNRTFVSNPADIQAFQSAPKGSVYIEFDVDKNYIFQAGQENWGQIPGPGSKFDRLLEKRGVPILDGALDVYNIEKIGEK